MSNNALSPIRGESAFFSAIIAGNAGNAMYFSPPLSLSFAAPTGPLGRRPVYATSPPPPVTLVWLRTARCAPCTAATQARSTRLRGRTTAAPWCMDVKPQAHERTRPSEMLIFM